MIIGTLEIIKCCNLPVCSPKLFSLLKLYSERIDNLLFFNEFISNRRGNFL